MKPAILAGALGYWRQRNVREKRLLLAAGLVVSLAAIWTVAESLHHEQERLARALPRAEAQLAQIRHNSAQYAQIAGERRAGIEARNAAPDPLRSRLHALGVPVEVAPDGAGIRLRGDAAFEDLIKAIAVIHKELGLRVEQLHITRQSAGLVRLDVLLMPAGT